MMIKKANDEDGLTKDCEVGLKELGSQGKTKTSTGMNVILMSCH
jgi:hypothetical protein